MHAFPRYGLAGAALVAVCLMHGAPAHADDTPANHALDGAYFTDGHAFVVYGSLAGLAGIALFLDGPDQPRLFDASEGGAPHGGNTVPTYAVGGLAALSGALVIFTPTDARWYHVKGMAEAMGTTLLATELAKRVFGRHRPDYVAGDPLTGTDDGRRSFFSGHASVTLASMTYLGLYLRQHVFPTWKPDKGTLPWWEVATYAGLAAVAVYVPVSRVLDNRHHPGDVLVGSVVGLSMSTLFYVWQESRYRRSRSARTESDTVVLGETGLDLMLVPMGDPIGASVIARF